MIGEPPSEEGAVQLTTTLLPEIVVVGVPGLEGIVDVIIAQLPYKE